MGRIIAKLGVFGGRCDFKGHKSWYLQPTGGLPDPRGSIGAPVVVGTVMEGLRTTFA